MKGALLTFLRFACTAWQHWSNRRDRHRMHMKPAYATPTAPCIIIANCFILAVLSLKSDICFASLGHRLQKDF